MKSLKLSSLLFLITLLFSCNKSDDNSIPAESIGLELQNADSFSGEKEINSHKLTYKVTLEENNYYNTKFTIDNQLLIANVYFNDEHIDFLSENITLTTEEKETLLALGEEISTYLFQEGNTDDFSMPEYTLLRLLEYWARSPEGFQHAKRTSQVSENRLGKNVNEGITCVRKNTFVTAEYDNASGTSINERVQVNGDLCLGRCGSGCGSFFSLASAWTKDCLDHDQCGRQLGGSTNPLDRNCGDEYLDAADDYLFGVIRGCRG